MPKKLIKYPFVLGPLVLGITVFSLIQIASTSPEHQLAMWSAWFVSALAGSVLTAFSAAELYEKFEAWDI